MFYFLGLGYHALIQVDGGFSKWMEYIAVSLRNVKTANGTYPLFLYIIVILCLTIAPEIAVYRIIYFFFVSFFSFKRSTITLETASLCRNLSHSWLPRTLLTMHTKAPLPPHPVMNQCNG